MDPIRPPICSPYPQSARIDLSAEHRSNDPTSSPLIQTDQTLRALARLRMGNQGISPNARVRNFFTGLSASRHHRDKKLEENLKQIAIETKIVPLPDLSFISDTAIFSQEEQKTINDWINKLTQSKEFEERTQKIAKLVYDILVALKNSEEFRNSFFLLVQNNLESCEDRASMLLNLIFTEWKLCTMPEDAPFKDKFELITGIAKTNTLRGVLQNQLKNLVSTSESTEVFLYYEIELRERLKLITAVETMSFSTIGKRTVINEKALVEEVQRQYIYTLAEMPAVDKILEQNKDYTKEKKKVADAFESEMEDIESRIEKLTNLEYLGLCKEIKQRREKVLSELKFTFLINKLS